MKDRLIRWLIQKLMIVKTIAFSAERRVPRVLILSILALLAAGCGSGPSGAPQGTVITITFAGAFTPQAVATQVGGRAFRQAALLAGNLLVFNLPTGTTKYAVAYVCAEFSDEFVLEATVEDGTVLTLSCPGLSGTPAGQASGSADASAIAGASNVSVIGRESGGSLAGLSGPFSINLPVGTNDVAFVAFDSNHALGAKIVRDQSVPGVINNGNRVVFGPGDVTTLQTATVSNVPAGFFPPPVIASYHTVNGTSFPLQIGAVAFANPSQYPAVPSSAALNGDFYLYSASSLDTATFSQFMGVTQTTTAGGGPVSMALPAPWTFSGPAPAAFPTFTFNYSGFSGLPAVSQRAIISWSTAPTNRNLLTVTATQSFQNGATTLSIPDLTSLNGFFAPAASGARVSWSAEIFGGTVQEHVFSVNPPPNASISFVETRGTYIQP
jgi:hypothetical protein